MDAKILVDFQQGCHAKLSSSIKYNKMILIQFSGIQETEPAYVKWN